MSRELILDTETTGLDPKDGHRVIELACVELMNFIPTGATWHWYFNPQRDVPKAATDVHGLTAKFLADKPLFGDMAQDPELPGSGQFSRATGAKRLGSTPG